ncbi:hypothetical protein BT63DRAFT_483196 [Microthyrium microscopicum]|uniref:Gamma-glutamylcyclotransferase AIG2-like domain-containing protein n=1 Tax=Microthyrium microscopicum TaxID=703497 RepID=A0A6A6U0N9_9PEZI|nr:hypothetical protein BT63DRAFT_483196 [Microthyrium microscopicum]
MKVSKKVSKKNPARRSSNKAKFTTTRSTKTSQADFKGQWVDRLNGTHLQYTRIDLVPPPAEPEWYFFYDSLKDLHVLAEVARLDEPPAVVKAHTTHSCIKYSGRYAVLCQGYEMHDTTVEGVIWHVSSAEIVERLRVYYGEQYYDSRIIVALENGEEKMVRIFHYGESYDEDLLLDTPSS